MGSVSQRDVGLRECVWIYLAFWCGYSMTETWVRGYEEHTTGYWLAACRSFPRQLAGEPPCREQTGRSVLLSCSCLLLSQLVRTCVDATSRVQDALVDAVSKLDVMWWLLEFFASCTGMWSLCESEVSLCGHDSLWKIFIMPSKEPRAFPCHKDAPDHYLFTSLWDEGR